MQRQRLPYGARNDAERQRNLARLGRWQERKRSWDERLGDVQPALPLLPLVCMGGILLLGIGGIVLLRYIW